MITSENKCDGKCQTCNIMQQTYCKLVQFRSSQDEKLVARLADIEESVKALERHLSSEVIIAQGGDGAQEGKVSDIITS